VKRVEQKKQTHRRIVEVAARRFREAGLTGVSVQQIMEEAGLTHGGFYSHFGSKADLAAEAIAAAMATASEQWLEGLDEPPGPERCRRLLFRYLSRAHRDAPGASCPLPATSADVARAPACVRHAYADGLRDVIARIEAELDGDEATATHERAVGTLALCIGGLLLARAVDDPALSDDILKSCRSFGADAGSPRER
jgi:TetR/AcrR family transcriptional repressor of nem operon